MPPWPCCGVSDSDSDDDGEANKNADEAVEGDDEVSWSEDDVNEAEEDEEQFQSLMKQNGEFLCPHGIAVVQSLPAFRVECPKTILGEMKRA